MSFLEEYFNGAYRIRLLNLRKAVLARRPPIGSADQVIHEYAAWLQKELDFFHKGTANTLRFAVGELSNLEDRRLKLMVTEKFVNEYLLGEVTEEHIDKLFNQ